MGISSSRTAAGTPDLPGAHAIMELARVPMAITEGATHIVRFANAALCSVLGRSREDLVGKPFNETLPAGHECLLLLDRVYRTGKPESHTEDERAALHPTCWSYEVWSVVTEGDRPAGVMIQVSETTLFHQQATAMNEALLLSGIRQHELTEAADILNAKLQAQIKERIQTEEALLRSEKLASVGRMAASIAHEINNPLEAVMNTIFLAGATPGLPPSAREYLKLAEAELNRVAHTARQTLGFYRDSAAPAVHSAQALLDSVVYLLQGKIKAKQIFVEIECKEQLQVAGVFGELRQVLSNLLANSLEALDENGRIKMRASVSPGLNGGPSRIRITVADNGNGIGTIARKQLFEPFFTTKGAIGNGLGLWVSKQLIEKHGGSIRLHSSTSGNHRGTTFSVVLPDKTEPTPASA